MADENTEKRYIVKSEKHADLYSDGLIRLKRVRISYPHLFTPQENTDNRGNKTYRYSATFMMPKGAQAGYQRSKDLIRDQIDKILKEKKVKLPPERKFLRDGDVSGRDEYEGYFTIATGEKRQPSVRHRIRDPKTGKPRQLQKGVAGDEDVILPGYWVNAIIRPWYQDNKKGGKRVNAGLVSVMFVEEDEIFGGQSRVTAEDIDEAFDEFADDDDDSGYDDDDDI